MTTKESITNYKYVRFALWAMFIIGSLECIISLADHQHNKQVLVQPTFHLISSDSLLYKQTNVSVSHLEVLQLKHLTFTQKLLLPDMRADNNLLTQLLTLFIIAIVLTKLSKLHPNNLLKFNLTPAIGLITFIIVLFSYVLPFVQNYFADKMIQEITAYRFTLKTRLSDNKYTFWLVIALMYLGGLYYKAYQLKQEQDLTI